MKRPVTILSGFLGSGKTTMLNQILKADHGLRIVVMINDFGEVNIDKDLVVGQTGDVLELSGGCMCCTIRDDLLTSAQELLASGREFDYLIVETSGLADPGVVAQTFLVPALEERLRLDAVVTVVDGANIETWLERNPTATEQIRCADLLVVNKLDLIEPDDMTRIKRRLRELNDHAMALPSINGIVDTHLLLDIDAHQTVAPRADEPGHDDGHHGHEHERGDAHHHEHAPHADVLSASFAAAIELDYDRFDQFIQALPDGVYRAKGTVAIAGMSRRVIFHRVGQRNIIDQGAHWGDQERSCRAVLLGEEFDSTALLAALQACAASTAVARAN